MSKPSNDKEDWKWILHSSVDIKTIWIELTSIETHKQSVDFSTRVAPVGDINRISLTLASVKCDKKLNKYKVIIDVYL